MGGYYVICKLATLIVTVMCSCNGLCTVHGFVKRNKNSSGDEIVRELYAVRPEATRMS